MKLNFNYFCITLLLLSSCKDIESNSQVSSERNDDQRVDQLTTIEGGATRPGLAEGLYSQKISISEDSSRSLKTAANDAVVALQKMTGMPFTVENEFGSGGIQLLKSTSDAAPADAKKWLADKGREPFVIRAVGSDKLLIIANRDDGLAHGLYFYLEELGVRYYFPSEKWTIFPKKNSITVDIDRKMQPKFETRGFFGTGGFGPKLPIDPDQSIKARWQQWQIRNRFGGEFRLGGHTGEAFNMAHREILEKNPEFLAKVNGKHVPWSIGAKLNASNPEAVKLYVDWTVKRFRQAREKDPEGRGSFSVSVDPADGGGHCNSPECKAIGSGSVSDQVFYVANQAAKAVRAEFPDGYVNLYGYNQHAMPPTIPLEPNIYVSIIPYAFQRTGLKPEEFIEAWGKKVSRMGIYDYWSIPDWTKDLPNFDYLNTPGKKLRFWHKSNIRSFSSESSYSSGAIGLAWYAASRIMWDLDTDEQAIIEEFYEKAFGPAAPPMKRMMERWAKNFKLNSNELALSYRDMQEALSLAKTPEAHARLADYGRYLEYMRLQFVCQQANGDARVEANREFVSYVWDIYHSSMIHAYRIYQLQTRGNKEMRENYNSRKPENPAWKAIDPPTDAEIFAAIEKGVKQFQPLGYEPKSYSGKLVPVSAPQAKPREKTPHIILVGATTFHVLAQPGQVALPLKLKCSKLVRVQLKDDAGKLLHEESLERDSSLTPEDWQLLNLKLPKPGHYTVSLIILKNDSMALELPDDLLASFRGFRTGKSRRSPRMYFYVPKGLKRLAIYQPARLPEYMEIRFFDPTGAKVVPETHDGRTTYLVDIPDGMDGKIWSLGNLVSPNRSIQMLNAPQSFSLYETTLLVPEDALK